MEVAVISPEGEVAPFCRMVGADHRLSQATGPCFDPSGTRVGITAADGSGTANHDTPPSRSTAMASRSPSANAASESASSKMVKR